MVLRYTSMAGETRKKLRRRNICLLTFLGLLAIGLWLLATSYDAPSQTRIVTTIIRAQLLRGDDGQISPTGIDFIRAKRERFGRKQTKELLSRSSSSALWPVSLSSSYIDIITYTRNAARAWEHLLQGRSSGSPENIGLRHSHEQRLETRQGSNFARRISRRSSHGVLLSVEESLQPSWTAGLQPLEEHSGGDLEDFDWQTYLLYYPDLKQAGIDTEGKAREHYRAFGHAEGRLRKRLRVLLRYTACTGLINQHYSHIAAFVLSAALQSEIVLPPAVQRDSFGKYFSTRKDENEVSWTPAPLDSLLDVERIVEIWRLHGITVHKTPALLPFPDLTDPQTAYPLYAQQGVDEKYIARMENVYLQSLHLDDMVDRVRSTVMLHAGQLLRQDPNVTIDYIALDLPCTFFMLETSSNLPLVSEVARSLGFAPALHELANQIISALTNHGAVSYNAAHLRIEKDARDWSIIMGGDGVIWHLYKQAMRQAKFNASTPLYIASGLLTYGANDELANIEGILKAFDSCSDIFYKEMFLGEDVLGALTSEQKALVDFIVLAGGQGFVGFGSSTFSYYLCEYRALKGMSRASSALVNASAIGTDTLFRIAGTVTY